MTDQSVIPTCYRHADRETRLACSNCERAVCTDCVRPAAVGQRCLECAAPSERQRVMDMSDVRRASERPTPVTLTLMVVTIGIYVIASTSYENYERVFLAVAQINPYIDDGQWWRSLTHVFLHASIWAEAGRRVEPSAVTHILFNMYALYLFGPKLEREVGSAAFTALYFASAIAGSAAYYLLEPNGFAAGASGAIFGLFGAWLAASFRGRHTAAGRASLNQLLYLLALNAFIGFLPGLNIAWQAHLGGLIGGFAIASLWMVPALRERRAGRTLSAVAVGILALLILIL